MVDKEVILSDSSHSHRQWSRIRAYFPSPDNFDLRTYAVTAVNSTPIRFLLDPPLRFPAVHAELQELRAGDQRGVIPASMLIANGLLDIQGLHG